jgi:hypothetical protein
LSGGTGNLAAPALNLSQIPLSADINFASSNKYLAPDIWETTTSAARRHARLNVAPQQSGPEQRAQIFIKFLLQVAQNRGRLLIQGEQGSQKPQTHRDQ